ncbi:hypothetical protein ACNJYD_12355 [Bradyrhizobium sp. DASA03005]|uniref:hypothetical protein n=1 Tax=Bradyrhizobium TaxID=374 RepID=UPI00155F090C|nr:MULTISPECIES: hypothetical protein [Bradyrhizobium]MBR1167295.1 hypothetical protein [Bradyrhizobium liaoningense]MDA9499892.1 hypothetical protein [Bradyrhizobium sp. CCBAU 11357]MDD1518517.1 hypothetical protein [Bradyrhizobium sp. WBAH30]MDD1542315.1 hypothetical protein [Bradyrhizobium sp. WBAH41]MDD1556467.1 hypothetical protein [Bradyrhizobium sp. WBAH23]
MMQYRAYLIGEDGVFRSAEAFEAPSDSSALSFAQRFTRLGKVEVWQLGRKIAVLDSEQSRPPLHEPSRPTLTRQ